MLRLALLIAPFALVDGANAACAPTSPVAPPKAASASRSDQSNGTDGYGTVTDTGNTYNISGASVAGADTGLVLRTSGTVNNFGTITGAGAGGGTTAASCVLAPP